MKTNKPILFFDGICTLCNASVQFVIKRDKKNKFLFASLQSDVAKNILLHKNHKINLDSIVLLFNDKIYTKSTAALLVLKELGFPYNIFAIFMFIPKVIRDYIYDFIAKNRYEWFGKRASCMVPNKDWIDKFL